MAASRKNHTRTRLLLPIKMCLPFIVPLPTLADAAINARGMPGSGERFLAEFSANRPTSGTVRGHGVSPTWDIRILDADSKTRGPFAPHSSVSARVQGVCLAGLGLGPPCF